MGLRAVIVRDDDVCYFTDVRRFCIVHRLLLNQHLPFAVAAIPLVSDHVVAQQGGMEGFIPTALQNQGRFYEITRANELISFMQSRPEIEVTQHGFQHVRLEDGSPEFSAKDKDEILRRICQGKALLHKAFGHDPQFFVPPFDTVSGTALALIKRHFRGISFSRYSHSLLPIWLWPAFELAKLRHRHLLSWGDFLLTSHPGSDLAFLPTSGWQTTTLPASDVLVVAVHSWMFFDERGAVRSEMLRKYEGFINMVRHEPGMHFLRFADLIKR